MSTLKSSDMLNKLQDLSNFVNRLPVTSETKNQIYNALVKMARGSSSINNTIQELKEVQIVPDIEHEDEISYDEVRQNIQEKLNQLLDEFWLMIDEENAIRLHEASQKIREIFNNIFNILTKQGNEIDNLKNQVQSMQVPHDALLLGSVTIQLIVKMSRFENTGEHPSIAAYKTVSMIMTQAHVEQLKTFLNSNGYSLEETCLAVQVLKSNRLSAVHPDDPSTSLLEIQNAINRLFPTTSNPKRAIAQKALKVLEILSKQLQEPLFIKIN